MIPLVTVAQVVAQAPDLRGLYVVLTASAQGPSYPVKIGHVGPYDALRVDQHPLPSVGSLGVVVFPRNDSRNGVWIATIAPNLADAVTTTGAGVSATDPFLRYLAHYSGHWELLDGQGNQATQWADGSTLVAGSASGLPTTYRHVVDPLTNVRSKVPLTRAQRVPSPPGAFGFNFAHESGTRIAVPSAGGVSVATSGGGVTIAVASGQALSITANGAAIAIDSGGNVTVSGNFVTIEAAGQVKITGSPIFLN